jgi:hypothetical protein
MSYHQLTTAALQAEQTKQQEIVQGSSPDNSLDEAQKLFVIEALLDYRKCQAERWKQQPEPRVKAPLKDRQKGVFPRPGRVATDSTRRILFGKSRKGNTGGFIQKKEGVKK